MSLRISSESTSVSSSNQSQVILKIVILVARIARSGPIAGAVALSKYLRSATTAVTLVSLEGKNSAHQEIHQELEREGVAVEYLNLKGWLGLCRYFRFQKYVEESNVHGVISYGLRPNLANALAQGKHFRAASVRNCYRQEYLLRFGPIAAKLFGDIDTWSLKKTDRIFSVPSSTIRFKT